MNLRWQPSTAPDFDHYNLYTSRSELRDTKGLTPVHQIRDSTTRAHQVVGLEIGIRHSFAVAAVDKSGNENRAVVSASAAPTRMPRGNIAPDLYVDLYASDAAWPGTTILPVNHDRGRPRIVEVNLLGEVVWEYRLPEQLSPYTNPGFDVELLPTNNILMVLPGKGVYEINRQGEIVWSYLDTKVSHDADRLPNGNTLVVYGNFDSIGDAQVKEVSPAGQIVWAWYAGSYFNKAPYKDIYQAGWTHTNAATRLANGNTLISTRNFNLLVEVDARGAVVRTIGEGLLIEAHDPEPLPNGNILVANHGLPEKAIEIDPVTGRIVWQFPVPAQLLRDANRLPNGNTLITGGTVIIEVTPEGRVVWQLRLRPALQPWEAPARGFYKAERVSIGR
ncbi:MAG: aryl-sulfate sulfotransferase [Chloroflexi bacterium]|nr:aryl-sulfate sulfotransferase [Chloroflexota bacterium]